MNVRLDVPIVHADLPGGSKQEGLGDVSVRLNYRYRNEPRHSALVGGTMTLDSASDDALGDGTKKLTGVWVNSWRKQAWLLSAVTTATWSESGEHDAGGVVPIVAYQPMRKHLSYVSLGLPVIRDLDDDETVNVAIVRLGRVFRGDATLYVGTRVDLSGNAEDDLVVTIGYRRMLGSS